MNRGQGLDACLLEQVSAGAVRQRSEHEVLFLAW
jgi:hypothetical protein